MSALTDLITKAANGDGAAQQQLFTLARSSPTAIDAEGAISAVYNVLNNSVGVPSSLIKYISDSSYTVAPTAAQPQVSVIIPATVESIAKAANDGTITAQMAVNTVVNAGGNASQVQEVVDKLIDAVSVVIPAGIDAINTSLPDSSGGAGGTSSSWVKSALIGLGLLYILRR